MTHGQRAAFISEQFKRLVHPRTSGTLRFIAGFRDKGSGWPDRAQRCRKTTFIKTLAGLLKGYRLDGAKWEGRPFGFRDRAFQRDRFIVFAEDRSFPYFTFREYLAYAAASYGVPQPDASGLVKGFHFEAYTDVLLKELSTGNRKKAYLITAFALRPKLLLLDEAVNGLDFQSTEFLYQLMGEYKKYGALLFSSHILESICLTADRVLVLEHGKIGRTFSGPQIAAGNIREVLWDEEKC